MHHFAARGLYNGGLLLGDRESGSFWHHLTGKCLHGPLRGHQIGVFPLLHTRAGQALAAHPDAQFALSRPSLKQRVVARAQEMALKLLGGQLPPGFGRTMGAEDSRRPRMERGLAVWTDRTSRFYPSDAVRTHGSAVIDQLDGRRTLVYMDPALDKLSCLRTEAKACAWENSTLALDTGESIRGGFLYDRQGTPQAAERPMHSTVCWYAFGFAFPGGQVYEG